MKNENINDFIELFEKNKKLPHKSKRKYIGFFIDFLRSIFSPFFEFFLAAKFETQRKANLGILYEINEIKNSIQAIKTNLENFSIEFSKVLKEISRNFEEISKTLKEHQNEILILRDEKIPLIKEAIKLGIEGIDMKAEWALSNLISLKEILSKEVPLSAEEKKKLKETIKNLNFLLKFRGNEAEIKKRQRIYVDKLKERKMVIDLGCGRGEFLEILKENFIPSAGVEKEPSLCAILKEKNLNFFQMDVLEFLEKKPIEFDSIVSFHLIEHLNFNEALKFLKLIYESLPKNGFLLIETPNPSSLFSLINFYKDPEHKTPWHPETLKFFLNEIGFEIIEEFYLQKPEEFEKLDVNENLKNILFGPQDYAFLSLKK